ncbi:MAG: 1-deoxy-D-xylulose-5-phosphate reductoisomerase, partial [Pseudomonadota bacterium]
ADCVMAAIMGAAGLRASLSALHRGARLALANKECLVCAGDVFMREVQRCEGQLLPVDSEHSAIFQALEGQDRAGLERVTVTASGGPFRTWSKDEIEAATLADALNHPNWSMGRKITVDSATMMNKGLELIEARFLFDLAPEQLDVVVHPQSIIHSMVSYTDGSVIAQLGMPDMRTPIAYALSWPRRMKSDVARLDLAQLRELTFEAPDEAKFPALRLAREAMTTGGGAPAVLNAANEIAVGRFLEGRMRFADIARTVETTLDRASAEGLTGAADDLDAVLAIDHAARDLACHVIG